MPVVELVGSSPPVATDDGNVYVIITNDDVQFAVATQLAFTMLWEPVGYWIATHPVDL